MKRLIKHLSICHLIVFALNTSFAQDPINWTRDEINPGEDLTITPDESLYTEGTKSCYFQLQSGAAPYLVSDIYFVTPGEEYEFSLDVFDNDTAGQVKVYADFYDTYGFNVFGKPPEISVDSSSWQTIIWGGVVPDQAVVGYVLLKFYCQPDFYNFTKTAHIWVDNIKFVDAAEFNLLANGGFEEWNVGVNEMPGQEGMISVYPNPSAGSVTIELKTKAEFVLISDLTGREVLKYNAFGKEKVQVDVNHLQKGIYIVRAILQNKSVVVRKLLID